LWARALVFDDGERRIGMVACDLSGVSEQQVAAVRKEAASAAGLAPEALLVAGTHTHAAVMRRPAGPQGASGDWLPGKIAQAVAAAAANLVPVKIATASGWSAIGINRRMVLRNDLKGVAMGPGEFGVFDPEVAVVRVERVAGGPLACLINYACHPVCMMHDDYISADYPGFARDDFEREIGGGVTAIFFQGCAGNINPRMFAGGPDDLRGGQAIADHTGWLLAEEVLRVWREMKPSEGGAISYMHRRISLPVNPERAIKVAEERLRDAANAEAAQSRLERVKERAHLPIECEIQALQVGNVTFVSWPGEIFCELGMKLKQRSPFRPTYVLGYANGSIGYVPTPEAFHEGGTSDYSPSFLQSRGYEPYQAAGKADNAGTVLVEESLALLKTLKA
jgi:hypothetical protein